MNVENTQMVEANEIADDIIAQDAPEVIAFVQPAIATETPEEAAPINLTAAF